jgi:hypothetical protein
MQIDMNALARVGARARLAELAAEMDAIRAAFSDLGGTPPKKRGRPATNVTVHSAANGTMESPEAEEQTPVRRGRKPMSAAAKKAVGERMKAYWAARRTRPAESEKAPEPESKPVAKRTLSAEGRARISAAAKKRWRAQRKAARAV